MNKETAVRARNIEHHLSPDDVVKALELLRGSNSVELKLVIPDRQRGAIKRLGFDPVEAEPRLERRR